jgi:hypothetical protein
MPRRWNYVVHSSQAPITARHSPSQSITSPAKPGVVRLSHLNLKPLRFQLIPWWPPRGKQGPSSSSSNDAIVQSFSGHPILLDGSWPWIHSLILKSNLPRCIGLSPHPNSGGTNFDARRACIRNKCQTLTFMKFRQPPTCLPCASKRHQTPPSTLGNVHPSWHNVTKFCVGCSILLVLDSFPDFLQALSPWLWAPCSTVLFAGVHQPLDATITVVHLPLLLPSRPNLTSAYRSNHTRSGRGLPREREREAVLPQLPTPSSVPENPRVRWPSSLY